MGAARADTVRGAAKGATNGAIIGTAAAVAAAAGVAVAAATAVVAAAAAVVAAVVTDADVTAVFDANGVAGGATTARTAVDLIPSLAPTAGVITAGREEETTWDGAGAVDGTPPRSPPRVTAAMAGAGGHPQM